MAILIGINNYLSSYLALTSSSVAGALFMAVVGEAVKTLRAKSLVHHTHTLFI